MASWRGAVGEGKKMHRLLIDSHMKFAPGWDAELLRMIKATPTRKAVLTHYPVNWEYLNETQVPIMWWVPCAVCPARQQQQHHQQHQQQQHQQQQQQQPNMRPKHV
ncbi:hypothetical protein TSOC_008113, partial [Tetrabaena socialis]